MSKPIWLTPSGFLFTATINVYTSTNIVAGGAGIKYSVISGKLPDGLHCSSSGFIYGTPTAVTASTSTLFVVRAKNIQGVADNYFTINVPGPANPLVWSTANTFTITNTSSIHLAIGPSGEPWLLNKQYVNYQLVAIPSPNPLPSQYQIKYYTSSALPPGLTLSTDGRIFGYVNDRIIGSTKNYNVSIVAVDGITQISENIVLPVNDLYTLSNSGLSYVPPIQFVADQNLYVRTLSREIIDLSGYDPYPELGTVSYTLSGDLPLELTFDTSTGFITGPVDYQPVYTKTYPLTIRADKNLYGLTTSSTASFNLTIEGTVYNNITWITSSSLNSLATGQVSSIQLESTSTGVSSHIEYKLASGMLPSGLTLMPDGSIVGQSDYGSAGTYSFVIEALDAYNSAPNAKTFTLTVTDKEFTKIYLKPFLSRNKREIYQQFVLDSKIFPQSLLYRPNDLNFGVQNEIRMYLEFGIQRLDLANYVIALRENFYRKHIYFSDLKTAVARDSAGNIIYEIVYLEAKDRLINNAEISSELVVYINGQVYYPNSITNMREALERMIVSNIDGSYTNIKVDSYNTPKYMQTTQSGSYQLPGYMRVIPICYTLPGQSTKIVDRIKASGFDFKQFDFDVDRIIVENALDQGTAKYLVFGRNSLFEQITSDNVIYDSKGPTLDTQNSNPLTRE